MKKKTLCLSCPVNLRYIFFAFFSFDFCLYLPKRGNLWTNFNCFPIFSVSSHLLCDEMQLTLRMLGFEINQISLNPNLDLIQIYF